MGIFSIEVQTARPIRTLTCLKQGLSALVCAVDRRRRMSTTIHLKPTNKSKTHTRQIDSRNHQSKLPK